MTKEKAQELTQQVVGTGFAYLGIGDASSLLLTVESSGGGRKLFKVDRSGAVVAVKVTDVQGNPAALDEPDFVEAVSVDYLLLSTAKGSYLVRRSDGRAAKIEERSLLGTDGTPPRVRVDERGNAYYLSRGALVRISLAAGLDQLAKTPMSRPELETVESFEVKPDGTILALVSPEGADPVVRIHKLSGGIQIVKRNPPGTYQKPPRQDVWILGDRFLVYTDLVPEVPYPGAPPMAGGLAFFSFTPQPDGNYRKDVSQSRVFQDYWAFPYMGGLALVGKEFYEPHVYWIGGTGEPFRLANIWTVKGAQLLDGILYVYGSNMAGLTLVDRIDLTKAFYKPTWPTPHPYPTPIPSHEIERVVLEEPEEYQFFKVTVVKDGEFLVTGLRLTDSTYVVGTMDGSGRFTVLSAELPQVQQILTLR